MTRAHTKMNAVDYLYMAVLILEHASPTISRNRGEGCVGLFFA